MAQSFTTIYQINFNNLTWGFNKYFYFALNSSETIQFKDDHLNGKLPLHIYVSFNHSQIY